MQSNSSATLVDHALLYLIVETFLYWKQCWCFGKRHFGLMALSNLLISNHTWMYSMLVRWIFSPFNKNSMIIFTQFLCTSTMIVRGIGISSSNWHNSRNLYHAFMHSVVSVFLAIIKNALHIMLPAVYNWRPSSMVEHFRGTNFPCIYHRKGFQCTDLKKNLVGRLECRYPDGNKIHSCRLHFSNGNSCTFCTLIWLDSYTSYARLKF